MATKMNPRMRLIAVIAPISATWLYVLAHVFYLIVHPESREQMNLALMNRTPQSFEELRIQTEKLNEITSNIENFSLGEIRQELQRTSRLVTISRKEFHAQYEAWLEVKETTSQDRESFLQLRAQLDDISRLQDNQIRRLRALLDESEKPGFLDSLLGLSGSFFLGVLSSVLASAAYERVWARRTKLPPSESRVALSSDGESE